MIMIRSALALLAVAALAAIDVRAAAAESYRPWCVQYLDEHSSASSCAFYSFEQCMETARGNGAFCHQNPWYLQNGERGQAPSGGDRPRARQR